MICLRIVIPDALGKLSLEAGTRGWFGGSGVAREHLAVIRESRVGEGEPIYAPGSAKLFDHWAFFNGSESNGKLVKWVSVRRGFGFALAYSESVRIEELTDWITDGQPPDLPDGETDSLCCLEPLEDGGVRIHLLVVFKDGSVTGGSVQTISAEPRLPTRLDGLRPIQALTGKRVGIVGVGSGGSMAALNLAASGVETLHLFDKDYLTTDNLFRHACSIRHLGRAKVHAVRSLIGYFDLPTSVSTYRQDVLGDATSLWKVMDEVDLILCATDNVISRRLVNYVCVRTATPLVMACTFRNAGIGEIIRVLPGESACYECTRLVLREAGALEADAEAGAAEVPYSLPGGDGPGQGAANQGTRGDVSMVAALLSRVAIMTVLADDPETERLPRDYMTWGGRAEKELPDPFGFERPFSVNWVEMRRREDCPVCATFGMPPDPEVDEEYEKITARLSAGNSPG
jgi:hypothetical protein